MGIKKPIFLLGFMGAGKSTVGFVLSKALERNFIDLDKEIEQNTQQSVTDLFSLGEEFFREAETYALREITKTEAVVATGGGTVLREQNRILMWESGFTIYLHVEKNVLLRRLFQPREKQHRPLLATVSAQDFDTTFQQLCQSRTPYYEKAHLRIDATDLSLEQTVEQIISQLMNA